MKCYNCSNRAIGTAGTQGTPLCLRCQKMYQNTLNDNISSAYQAHQGFQVAESISRYISSSAQTNQPNTNHIKIDRNYDVKNYHIRDNNIGILNTEHAKINDNIINTYDSFKYCNEDIIKTLRQLTEAVTKCNELLGKDKATALEIIDFLSDESGKPKEKRKSLLSSNAISQLANIMTITTGLQQIGSLCLPILTKYLS